MLLVLVLVLVVGSDADNEEEGEWYCWTILSPWSMALVGAIDIPPHTESDLSDARDAARMASENSTEMGWKSRGKSKGSEKKDSAAVWLTNHFSDLPIPR